MTDRNLTVLILLAVLLVVGTLVYRTLITQSAGEITQPANTLGEAEEQRSTQVKAILTSCNRDRGERTIATGHITNTGNVDLHYVTVRVLWLNALDLPVEANELYALNNEVLAPGKTRSFTDVTHKVTAVNCNVETVDWW